MAKPDEMLYGTDAVLYLFRRPWCALHGHRAWKHLCRRCGDKLPYYEIVLSFDARKAVEQLRQAQEAAKRMGATTADVVRSMRVLNDSLPTAAEVAENLRKGLR